MSIPGSPSKINIPHKGLICIIMLLGIILLSISLHLYDSIGWLTYTAIAVLALTCTYMIVFVKFLNTTLNLSIKYH